MAKLRRGTEEEVVWHEGGRAARNVRLPIGGKSVYVTRKEAAYLATVAQTCAILQMSDTERDAKLKAELDTLRASNPLLPGGTACSTFPLSSNIFLTA